MKKQVKKLVLAKETLQKLGGNLEHAVGGALPEPPPTGGWWGCSVWDGCGP
jgi:hypothetical protein